MFEREIKFIYDFNLNKVNRLGPYFTFEQLLASDLHPAILQYISAEIDYLIYEDRQKLLKNSLFDYSGEKISFLFNQISEEAKKSKRFAQEYIAKLILHASSFTVNYLVRPKWTLTKFVFDEENHKSTNDIKQILNYVYYYRYVNKILVSYINSKKILSMNAQEFEELLNKADKLGVETYLPAILTSALKSMAEFFNIGEIQKTKIPLSAVEMFLEEKELFKHLQKIGETFISDEGAKFNLIDYQKVFSSIVVEKEELMAEPELTEEFETKAAGKEEPEEEETIYTEKEEQEFVEVQQVEDDSDIERDLEPEPEDEYEEEEPELEAKPEEESEAEEESAGNRIIEIDFEDEEEQNKSDELPDESENDRAKIDKNENDDLEEEEEIEIQGLSGRTDDRNDESDDDIIISPPVKLRIKINEGNRIEPVYDTPETPEEDEVASEENEEEPIENEIEFESDDDLQIDDDLEISSKDEEENPDNKSFLQSLHDNDNLETLPGLDKEELDNDSFKFDEKKLKSNFDNSDVNEDQSRQKKIKAENEIRRNEFPFAGSKDDEENTRVDLAEILEHKEMTKIIEVIFDYDIEDFASLLDEISNCRNSDDAALVINQTLAERHISRTSKEAEAFKSIISEYFGNK